MVKKSVKQTVIALTLSLVMASAALPASPRVRYGRESRVLGQDGYRGEALLAGIFLGYGDVAEQLPEVWRHAPPHQDAALAKVNPEKILAAIDQELANAEAKGAAEEVQVLEAVKARVQERGLTPEANPTPFRFDVLIEKIRRHDPAFFDHFAQEIQSGEHLRIRRALRQAHDRITELWLAQGVGLLGKEAFASDSFIIQWTTIYIDTAVYSRTAIWEDRFIFGWFSANSPIEGALAEEILVNAIAEKFARHSSR